MTMIGYVLFKLHGKKAKAVLGDDLKWRTQDQIIQGYLNLQFHNTGPAFGPPGFYDLHHAAEHLKGKAVEVKKVPKSDPKEIH